MVVLYFGLLLLLLLGALEDHSDAAARPSVTGVHQIPLRLLTVPTT